MAQAGIYTPSAVIDADVTVRVNGVIREHVSMDWAGDSSGGLPDLVVSAGTSMRSRTGSIQWAQQVPVETEPPHPLRQSSGWPPREGDVVVIDASVDTGSGPYSWRRFTGRLGRTTGSLIDGTLTSVITDTLADSLNAQVTVDPMVADQRHYMRSHWSMYAAMAQAGLGTIPGPDADTVLWNGFQGGLRPLVGEFVRSGVEHGDGYGLSAWSGALTAPDGTARAGRDVLVMGRGSTPPADSSLTVQIGSVILTLTYRPATRTYALHSTAAGNVGSWPRADDSPLPVLALQILTSGVRVYTSPTTWVTVPSVSVPTSAAVIEVGGTRLTGVSARYMSGSRAPSVVARTAPLPVSITRSSLEQQRIPATRGVENVTARSVVDSWAEATLGAVWMDEHGKPVAVARDRLVTRPVDRTVYVGEKIFSGSWSIGDDGVRSRVEVSGQQVAIQQPRADEYRALIYQESSSRTIESAEVIERFIEAPAEMEWGPIDLSASRHGAGQTSGDGPAVGTWIWGVSVDPGKSDPGEWWIWGGTYPGGYSIQIERLGQRTLKLTETVTPPPGRTAYLKSPDVDAIASLIWAYRDVASPVIRGIWTTTWADYTVTGAATGPAWAEPLTHDAGWWLTPADAQRVADALAAEVTHPMATLSGVETLWDPTRQIGDVEQWIATDRLGRESWTANVLVAGYSESWTGNIPAQSVDMRVISWTDPSDGKTYADLEAVYAKYSDMGGTYSETFDALPVAL